MDAFAYYPNGLKTAVVLVLLIFSIISARVDPVYLRGNENESVKQGKKVLGSRPPRCVNRCLSCRPCMAALVTSPHHKTAEEEEDRGDESYYLLSWKCKCRDEYFEP